MARAEKKPLAIGYLGNVVDLWERLAEEDELLVELGSDQTSLHNPWMGGYYPVQLSFEEARTMMHDDPKHFKELVQESLRRQVAAINKLTKRGMHFWDYGNSFLLEASRAGADVLARREISVRTRRFQVSFVCAGYYGRYLLTGIRTLPMVDMREGSDA